MKEIECKFLVDKALWDQVDKPVPELIVQAFLHRSPELTVRVRIKGNKGFLTVKGKTTGITRSEFEYEIPPTEAASMITQFTDKQIRKMRYTLTHEGHRWEVDVFEGKLQGLILAELELTSETEQFTKPAWVTQDVSRDPNYYNAVLIDKIID